jgi:hypothetical protein
MKTRTTHRLEAKVGRWIVTVGGALALGLTFRVAGVLALLALLALGGATGGHQAAADPGLAGASAAPLPSLTDVSAGTRTPDLFTVTGADFTPGGQVYLAVYDQMGAKLYETRWVTASLATTVLRHQPGDGSLGRSPVVVPGGGLREAFGQLCGATAMMRALDEQTAVWSNWLTVEFACAVDGGDGPYLPGQPH